MRSTIHRFRAVIGLCAVAAALTTASLSASPIATRCSMCLRFAAIYGDRGITDTTVGIPAAVATDLARRIHRIEKLTRGLANEEGFLRAADEGTLLLLFNRAEGKNELLRAYASSFGSSEVPRDLFALLDEALDGLWQEITRLAPTYATNDGTPLMRNLAQALERRLRVCVPKATFVGGALREREWRVRLSALGLPESRSMSGVLFYRLPDQPWVICREFEIAQKYFERSEDDGPGEITFGSLRLQESA
jgi:hypothetical protein